MKRLSIVLKKKLHPFVSYAFLVGIGAIAVSGTASLGGPELDNFVEPGLAPREQVVNTPAPAREELPQDLPSLKAAAAQFAAQLAAIKATAAELERNGRPPSPELIDAIGQGEQLTTVIAQANSLADIGSFNAAMRLVEIGRVISENAKF